MQIKSNTFGKLMKIREGTVFSNQYMFIKEFIQNAQRSRAKNLYITVSDNCIRFKDDGVGCKNPDNVFTLDKSEWIGVDEGFGIGFWSCLAFTKLKEINVSSYKWIANVDVDNLFANEDLTVKKEILCEKAKGFEIELISEQLDEDEIYDIKNHIINISKYINIDIYLNNSIIDKIDIFDGITGTLVKEVDNRLFKAKLSIEEDKYNDIDLFYDRRKVDYLHGIHYVSGVVEPKKGKMTFKEPDRTDYLYDEKYYAFEDVLKREIKNMYMDLLKSNPSNDILTKYSKAISNYVSVKDYSKFLVFEEDNIDTFEKDDENLQNQEKTTQPPINIQHNKLSYVGVDSEDTTDDYEIGYEYISDDNSSDLEEISTVTNDSYDNEIINSDNDNAINERQLENSEIFTETEEFENQIQFNKEHYEINDYKVVQAPLNMLPKDREVSNFLKSKPNYKNSFVNFIKKTKNMVWVLKEDISSYSDEIALAEYCKLIVYKANNILEENTLREYGKLHIRDLKDSLIETYDTKNIGIKTKKEENFIKLLIPICEKYGLHMNIFSIANLSCKTELKIDGKTVYRNNEQNTKTKIYTRAVCSGNSILLDRNYLNLSRFKIKSDSIGINEFSLLMFVMKTLAHELAHYLYNTVDNTITHYQMEDKIYDEILNMYVIEKDYVSEIIKKYA